jgi:hypothetical protein
MKGKIKCQEEKGGKNIKKKRKNSFGETQTESRKSDNEIIKQVSSEMKEEMRHIPYRYTMLEVSAHCDQIGQTKYTKENLTTEDQDTKTKQSGETSEHSSNSYLWEGEYSANTTYTCV